LSLLIHQHAEYYRAFVFVSAAGHYALFPLLYNMQEVPLRIALLLVWMAVVYPYFYRVHQSKAELFSKIEWTYLIGFLPLEVYHVVGHALVFGQALPFLPLLLISVYSAVGILYAWVLLYRHHLLSN
jgi:alpha-1,3-glucosyltransferase